MKNIVLLIIRIILGAVFIYAGAVKIMAPSVFADSIDNYRMLPYVLVTLMAVILPWIELIAGILLVVGRWLTTSSLILIALNIIFIIALSSAIARGLDISCGCFSVQGAASKVGLLRLLEDAIYLIFSIVIFKSSTNTKYSRQETE